MAKKGNLLTLETLISNNNFGIYFNGTLQDISNNIASPAFIITDIYIQGIMPSLMSYFPTQGFKYIWFLNRDH